MEKEIKPKKKMSIYVALKKLAKHIGKKKLKKLPADFATNDKYLYQYP